MLIEHQESRHDTADWDDIYEGVAAVLESVLDGDSRASVAVQYSDMCRVCFANAILLVIENLPHTGDLDSAVLDAKELHADDILHWQHTVPGISSTAVYLPSHFPKFLISL